jgi:putative ABC transport system substrate-binding protein
MIRRRTILVGIAAALAPGRRVAQAQQRAATRRVGVLMAQPASDPVGQARAAALMQGLDARGWKEGATLRIDWRWANSDPALFARDAAALIAAGPDVLVAMATPSVEALQRQTTTIPIVFVQVIDPVGQGFVASLARPGGNTTGVSNYDAPMTGKWLQMLTQITPPVAHAAVLFNPATAPFAPLYMHTLEDAAASLGVTVRAAPCRDDAEIEAMMAALAGEARGGLLVLPESFTVSHRDAIIRLAARYRLPAVYPFRYYAAEGGLIAYGIDEFEPFRRAADYVDRILKGAKPGDLPVQRPTKFDLVINMKTAKALGVTVAPPLLATADEVIE